MKHLIPIISVIFLFAACQHSVDKTPSVVFAPEEEDSTDNVNLDEIQESGTLIAGTLSGPQNYYEWHGHGMGMQYLLADAFAQSIGARLEMQVAKDSTQLEEWLENGDIDFIAIEKPNRTFPRGRVINSPELGWICRIPSLTKAIRLWWDPGRPSEVLAQFDRQVRQATRMHRRPKWRDKTHGIISDYDALFRRYSQRLGWDWRLLAAQCFQESGFDPNAHSWAGADGLMQIVPSTARSLGLSRSNVYNPEANISAAARYLSQLNSQLSDITDPGERINFILASYNGGLGHIRDAMSLTREHGGNAARWTDVSHWVLQLQYPATYNSPTVRYGYMRGNETVGYVSNIHSHWREYRQAR